MRGATSTIAGTQGLPPAPAAADNSKALCGDATYKDVSEQLFARYSLGAPSIGSIYRQRTSGLWDTLLPGAAGTVLTSNGVADISWQVSSGRLLRRTVYLSGSGTHVPGSDAVSLNRRIIGGGGGGGGTNTAAVSASCAGGGAGGSYCEKFSASASEAYAVGAGGAGGAASTAGTNGGDTTLGGMTGKGGLGGNTMAATITPVVVAGGSAAPSTGGDINSSAMPGLVGVALSGTVGWSGGGGSSVWGGGGEPRNSQANGIAGDGLGGGGSGGCTLNGGATRTGGAGSDGAIVIDELS